MALDQSSSLAIERGLDRQASALLQADAIRQAQEREASMLLWDCDSGRFCLMHPTLLDDAATTMKIEITPTPTSPERIIFYAPETETPLLSLEMATLALKIHTSAINALPSLYILDTLFTAMLALLLHLHRSCADPASRHSPPQSYPSPDADEDFATTANGLYFPPPPPSLHSTTSRRDLRRNTQRPTSRASVFRSVRSMKSTRSLGSTYSSHPHDKDIELGELEHDTSETVGHHGMKFEKRKREKGIVDADDPGLPKGTKMVLRFLYWGFEVVYWILGALVQLLAAAVVGLGKFATKL